MAKGIFEMEDLKIEDRSLPTRESQLDTSCAAAHHTPVIASGAMSLSSVSAIGNALRLRRAVI